MALHSAIVGEARLDGAPGLEGPELAGHLCAQGEEGVPELHTGVEEGLGGFGLQGGWGGWRG